MKKSTIKAIRKGHPPACTCSLCGQKYKNISFKGGYVCESCISYVKDFYADPACNTAPDDLSYDAKRPGFSPDTSNR